jgi:hypothetical protein
VDVNFLDSMRALRSTHEQHARALVPPWGPAAEARERSRIGASSRLLSTAPDCLGASA